MQEINMEWLHFIMLEKMDNLTWFFFSNETFWVISKDYVKSIKQCILGDTI